MVDYESYFQYGPADGRNGSLEPANAGPGCACSDCQSNEGLMKNYRTRFDKPKSEDWEEEQYLICPPRVLGYILKDKKWAQLQVTYLSDIDEDESETNSLNERLKLADDEEFIRQGKGGISRGEPKAIATKLASCLTSLRYQHKRLTIRLGQKPHVLD